MRTQATTAQPLDSSVNRPVEKSSRLSTGAVPVAVFVVIIAAAQTRRRRRLRRERALRDTPPPA